MNRVKSTSIKILGLMSIIYYCLLCIFGGKISFSEFWLALGILIFIVEIIMKMNKDKKIKINKRIKLTFITLILFGIVSFIILEGCIVSSGISRRMEKSDYLVILGAGLRGEQMSLTLTQRMYKGLEYIGEYPDVKVIVSGGQGPGESITEAEAMERFLINHGVRAENIIREQRSTSTAENLKYTKHVIEELDSRRNVNISIVTSDFHMFRAKFLAKREGFKVYTVPAKIHFLLVPNFYVREYFAIINSYFS